MSYLTSKGIKNPSSHLGYTFYEKKKKRGQMASKPVHRWSTSSVSRNCQWKAQWDNTTPIRMANIQESDNNKRWWSNRRPRSVLLGNMETVQPLCKAGWQFLTQLNIIWPCDQTTWLLLAQLGWVGLKTYACNKNCPRDITATYS